MYLFNYFVFVNSSTILYSRSKFYDQIQLKSFLLSYQNIPTLNPNFFIYYRLFPTYSEDQSHFFIAIAFMLVAYLSATDIFYTYF